MATALAYLPAMWGGFLWDDNAHVTKPELRSFGGLIRIWFELGATQQYYPLLHSAFWLEHWMWGDWVVGYHVANLALHLSAAGLVYLLLERLKVPGALLATAIFALHPVQVESVAWITEQKNTLSAVFYLSAMLAYLRFDESRRRSRYALALTLFVLGLLTKTVTATLPAALLVIFWWQRGAISWRRDVRPLVPFFLLGAVAGALTAWVERTLIGAAGAGFELTAMQRGLLAGRVVWFYLATLFWPANLMFIYPRWNVDPAAWWQWLFPLATIAALAGMWALRRRWRAPLAGWLFFIGTLFPALGFLNVYPFLYSFVADHFQYLASLGMITLAASAITLGLARLPSQARWAGNVLCIALVGILALLTWRQSRTYRDVETLYRTTIERNPDCWMAYNNLGAYLIDSGQSPDEMDLFLSALGLNPDYAQAHYNLANALARAGKFQESIDHYRQAVRIRPNDPFTQNSFGDALTKAGQPQQAAEHYRIALQLNPNFAVARNSLAAALLSTGETQDAISLFRRSLELKPNDADAHCNLAIALQAAGKTAEAIQQFQRALESDPKCVEAHNNLGVALAESGRRSAAIAQYEAALRLRPNYVEAHNNYGNVLVDSGRLTDAIEQFQQALKIGNDNPKTHNNLGNALRQAGRIPESVDEFRVALRLQEDYAEAHSNLGIALFAAGQREEAIAQFHVALRLKPDYAEGHNNLGNALLVSGRPTEAIPEFARALELKPDGVQAENNLGDALRLSGRALEAIDHYHNGLRLKPESPEIYYRLALSYSELNRPADAIAAAEQGLRLAQSARNAAAKSEIEAWLFAYRAAGPLERVDEKSPAGR